MKEPKITLQEDQIPIWYYGDRVTVCLVVDRKTKEALARGVSVCSPNDQLVKKVGRNKALGRALQAMYHRRSSGSFEWQRFKFGSPTQENLRQVDRLYHCKSYFKPILLPGEQKLVAAVLWKPDAGITPEIAAKQ